MLSRVAENIYWMFRYVERAENMARLIRVNTQLVLDTPKGITPGWEPLVSIIGLDNEFSECCSEPTERHVVRYLIDDKSNHSAIVTCLNNARENCRVVREVIPRSAWELLNELTLYAREFARSGISQKGREEYLADIITGSQQFGGLIGSVLYRDEGFHFARIGRNLERSDMTTRILDVRSTDLFDEESIEPRTLDSLQWISVLKSMSGFQSYRRHIQIRVRRGEVLNFLLKDMQFPRSVLHCLGAVEESLSTFVNANESLKEIRKTTRAISNIDTDAIPKKVLHDTIDDMQLGIINIHNSMAKQYFM
jgi:uncharacterized alpha-E superfamily protein